MIKIIEYVYDKKSYHIRDSMNQLPAMKRQFGWLHYNTVGVFMYFDGEKTTNEDAFKIIKSKLIKLMVDNINLLTVKLNGVSLGTLK